MKQAVDRQIVLDTETTGFEPSKGHRLVEIGCVELVNLVPSGRTFHTYINPEREVPHSAFRVHGLHYDFLKKFSTFERVIDGFLDFLQDAPLVIHNAKFDMGFIQYELNEHRKIQLNNPVIDTLMMAREKYPGAPASLDMLCKRFGISLAKREKHGALLDAELLASVYLELMGGREPGLDFQRKKLSGSKALLKAQTEDVLSQDKAQTKSEPLSAKTLPPQAVRVFPLDEPEENDHKKVMSKIRKNA